MRWYVYVYYDEDHQPFYCGKGCAGRAYQRHDVPVPPRERMVFRYFDDEEQAFELERNLISFWGRRDFEDQGLLLNKCSGGPGQPGIPKTKKQLQAAVRNFDKARLLSPRAPKEFLVTPPDGVEYKIFNLTEFCKNKNLHNSCMIRVAQGERKHHKGWTCRYA